MHCKAYSKSYEIETRNKKLFQACLFDNHLQNHYKMQQKPVLFPMLNFAHKHYYEFTNGHS